MKLKNNMLHVYHRSTELISVDHSLAAYKMGVADELFSITLAPTHSIEIGYKKPIRQIYCEVTTPNTNNSKLTIQYYDGAWKNLPDVIDETRGFKKSGFIYFGEDVTKSIGQALNGEAQIWLRIKTDVATSAVVFNGINLLFCSNDDINSALGKVRNFTPNRGGSHVIAAKAARDHILRKINNSGKLAYAWNNTTLGIKGIIPLEQFTAFDIFDIDELRDCAVQYAIFHSLTREQSDDADDVYRQQGLDFYNDFQKSFELFNGRRLTLDQNDDGIKDDFEKLDSVSSVRIIR